MPRIIKVAAAQLGPISREETRSSAINRMISLMRKAKKEDANFIVYPELALTTFFPRWYFEKQSEIDEFFETEMPNDSTRPLFNEACKLKIALILVMLNSRLKTVFIITIIQQFSLIQLEKL